MTDLRVAIAGYGLAGRTFHAALVAATPGLEVTAVVTRSEERRRQLATDHPGAVPYDDLGAALHAGVDLVVVASTNETHAELARQAIDAEVAVVVDKPLAVTADGARGVVERARRSGVPLTVFQNRRWDSELLTLQRVVADGELGEVHRLESRFERWRPDIAPGKWRESLPAERGGGQLLDLGAHLVDQATVLLGPVVRVYAEVAARRGGADDDAFLALEHTSGARSHLSIGAFAAAPGPRLRVLGSRAALLVERLDSQEDALRAGRRPAPGERWGVEPPDARVLVQAGETVREVPRERGRWDVFYPAVRDALLDGAPLPVDPSDPVRVLEVVEAARRSSAEHAVVAV